jgi:hypothetical protein
MSTLRVRLALLLVLTTAAACGGGGLGADGGVSGTGVSSVTGNVSNVNDAGAEIAGIRVVVEGTDIETVTGTDGSFTLSGEFDGEITLVFERDDGARAQTTVDVPTGGSVQLEDVTLDVALEEARPARRIVRFQGLVDRPDCPARRLRVVSRFDQQRRTFDIRLESTFVHDGAGAPVACTRLRAGVRVNVVGEVLGDGTIGNADVEVAPAAAGQNPEPTPTPQPSRTLLPTPPPGETDAGRTPREAAPTRTPRLTDVSPRPTRTPARVDRSPTLPTVTPRALDRPAPTAISARARGMSAWRVHRPSSMAGR